MAKILLIDDDAQFRKMLAVTIKKANFEVTEASTAEEGLSIFEQNFKELDIVITDIVLPDRAGIEIIMKLKDIDPNVRVIAVSGGGKIGSDSYLELANKLGAIATFQKPIDRKIIVEKLEEIFWNKMTKEQ